MAKILKKILSPDDIKAGESREKAKADNVSNLRQDRERNDVLLKPDGDADVTNLAAQMGRRLHRSTFVQKVQKLNPNVWYEQSVRYPAQGGLYIEDLESPYKKRFIVGFPHDFINEFSVPLTKPDVIPDTTVALHWQTIQRVDSKLPGWRAVLLKLLMEGLLFPSDIEREFKITEGRSSAKWQAAVS